MANIDESDQKIITGSERNYVLLPMAGPIREETNMSWLNDAISATRELKSFVPAVVKGIVKRPSPDDIDNLGNRLAATAAQYPDKTALIFEGRTTSFSQLDERASRVAQALHEQGIGSGDCVSMFMENRIEFVECFFGISRAGARVALINTNLKGPQLVHCITTTDARKLIFGSELADAVADTKAECVLEEGNDFLWVADDSVVTAPNWAIDFSDRYGDAPRIAPEEIPVVRRKERALYIFTSGTTGMPKAAIQPHHRVLGAMDSVAAFGLKISTEDRLYLCLPLYHATGLLGGLAPAIQVGATVVLRRKFSASQFLDEVREHNCNCFIYIGELCRYLLAQSERLDDGDNPLKKITGNGLRPDIWMEFKDRFQIERIIEFYGASEGNTGFMNLLNRDRTVGTAIVPPALIEYDLNADEIVRNEDGRCKRIGKGEVGLLIGSITRLTAFEGYTDEDATEKKILRNVFKDGDAYFNTGDLIREVDAGFAFGLKHYQFVDRVGDTFRWKGENCSTNEVGEIISRHPSVQVCNVYGVQVPGADGRAGMAALVLHDDQELDVNGISKLIQRDLASYARPVFLVVLPELQLTGTFKMVKSELRDAAYHPDRCSGSVYVLKAGSERYEPLHDAFYRQIMAGDAGY
jgi:citronellyl-CoA synthetase|tara:strand:+ start:4838 stop:6751 length:1914 start_codon:yes stop_codon:yes gene_type:complete